MLFLLTACQVAGSYDEREDWSHWIIENPEVDAAADDPGAVKVMTWNMKFAGGRIDFWFDGFGNRVTMTEDEVAANMEGLVDLIAEEDPDILIGQEIDVGSKRSAYVDMVRQILDENAFHQAAWVPNWEGQFIAEQGLGPMESGLAIWSKYPITTNERIDLGPIEDQAAYINAFYLDRAIQRSEIDLGTTALTVLNNHPDAYSSDGTKIRQVEEIFAEGASVEGPVLVGGDLNCVPPGSLRLSEFADDPASLEGRGIDIVDYESDGPVMDPFYEKWNDAIPLEAYEAATTEEEQSVYYTHSINKDVFWTRKLDYLFSDGTWTEGRTIGSPDQTALGVLDPMDLSDHAPTVGVLEY